MCTFWSIIPDGVWSVQLVTLTAATWAGGVGPRGEGRGLEAGPPWCWM